MGGCGSANRLNTQHPSNTSDYIPGLPNFDLAVISEADEEQVGARVFINIPYLSLVFTESADGYRAGYRFVIEARSEEGEMYRQTGGDTLTVSSYDDTQQYDKIAISRTLGLPPGEHEIQVTVYDENSDKRAIRREAVTVPHPEEPLALGQIHLRAYRDGNATPVAELHLRGGFDSLKATAPILNYDEIDPAHLWISVVKYRHDQSVAKPPYWLSPTQGSLAYRGIDYSTADTVLLAHQYMQDWEGDGHPTFTIPALEEGVYGIRVVTRGTPPDGEQITRDRIRDLSVKDPEFPDVTSLEEAINALQYIARESELRKIRRAVSTKEKRKRFDQFWTNLVGGNKQKASELIERYYDRIRQANLYFTTHKSGWKTDRGMIFVMLGAPVEVERRIDRVIWYYSYSAQDAERTFVFDRGVRRSDRDIKYETFVLQRQPYYQQFWRHVLTRWRAGSVYHG